MGNNEPYLSVLVVVVVLSHLHRRRVQIKINCRDQQSSVWHRFRRRSAKAAQRRRRRRRVVRLVGFQRQVNLLLLLLEPLSRTRGPTSAPGSDLKPDLNNVAPANNQLKVRATHSRCSPAHLSLQWPLTRLSQPHLEPTSAAAAAASSKLPTHCNHFALGNTLIGKDLFLLQLQLWCADDDLYH